MNIDKPLLQRRGQGTVVLTRQSPSRMRRDLGDFMVLPGLESIQDMTRYGGGLLLVRSGAVS